MSAPRPFARWLPPFLLILTLTACGGGDDGGGTVTPPPPPKTPVAIDDLRATAGADGEVTLAWTSPALGDKAGYDVRYDLRRASYGNEGISWDKWTILAPPANDTGPDTEHMHTVTGLDPGAVYVFRLTASTDGETWSEGSNLAVGTASPQFDTTPPEAVTTLALIGGTRTSLDVSWRTVGGDGPYGEADGYQVRYATAPIDEANWEGATPVAGISPAGEGLMSLTISGLAEDTEFYVAVKALDDAGNASAVSPPWSARTMDLRVIHVYVDGSGDYRTIEEALRAAKAGDLVLVGPGRYTWTNQGTGDLQTGMINTPARLDSVELRSTHGPGQTILDAEGQSAVMSITGGTVDPPGGERYWTGITVDGFTITGGLAVGEEGGTEGPWGGGGINAHLSDSVIRNCIFTGNEATQGGAVWIGGQGAAVLEDCVITGNMGYLGGGVLLVNSEPTITVRRCEITGNRATRAGGGLLAWHCSFEMSDCLVTGNSCGMDGGGLYIAEIVHEDPTIHLYGRLERVTVADNEAPTGAGLYLQNLPDVSVTGMIVAFNAGSAAIKSVKTSSGLAVGCTDLYGNPGGARWPLGFVDQGGNIQADPLFCDRTAYYLQSGSPCLAGCGQIGARGAGCGF